MPQRIDGCVIFMKTENAANSAIACAETAHNNAAKTDGALQSSRELVFNRIYERDKER